MSLEQIMDRIQSAKVAANELAELDRQLRAEHGAAVTAHASLLKCWEPVDAVVATMRQGVDAAAELFARERGVSIVAAFSGRYEASYHRRDDGELSEVLYKEIKPQLWEHPALHLRFRDLCGLVPELVKARLETIIRAVDYAPGPAMADRPAAIAAAAAVIREIEDRHADLVDAAGAMDPPIVLQLLEPVRERRAREAARLQREALALEARREAEARANASRAARRREPRVGYSEYLRSERRGPFA